MAGLVLAVLAGCGGGDGGGSATPDSPARLEIGAATNTATALPAGSVQTRTLEVRNRGGAMARGVVVSVTADTEVLHLPLGCNPVSACTLREDGAVVIAELAAGATLSLTQSLRIQPGHRGALSNDLSATGDGGLAVSWRQDLTAYATDLAVTIDPPEAVTVGGQPASRYVVTLTNAGPDDARDVLWELAAAPDLLWLASRCTASGGATCPATLSDRLSLPQLPKSSGLKVELTLRDHTRFDMLASRVHAAGDTTPANNRAIHSPYGTSSTLGHMTATDLQGRTFRLTLGWSAQLAGEGWTRRFQTPVDVTGVQFLISDSGPSRWWEQGSLKGNGGLVIGSALLEGVRTPFIAVRDPVTALSDLEGLRFNILGARADAGGKALDAFVWSGRFGAGAFEICTGAAPLAFEACPAERLQRYEAALNGEELELVSARHGVMRWRAARGADGPVLISSTRDATSGESRFMVGTPSTGSAYSSSSYPVPVALADTTFESASGVANAALVSFGTNAGGDVTLEPSRDLPNSYLAFLNGTEEDGLCGLSASLAPTVQTGVFTGPLQAVTRKGRACFAGSVTHVQTSRFAAMLGSKGDALMGRWLLQLN
jgi:hypothetical protein